MSGRLWLSTPVLFVTGAVMSFEAFCLLGAGPRTVIKDADYRVTVGVENPGASRVLGAIFLIAAVSVIVALTGRQAGARWWKRPALFAWGAAIVAIVVMLSSGLWSLGRAAVEPSFVWCGTSMLIAREMDWFHQVFLLVWLAVSGTWIALASTARPRPRLFS